MPYINYVREHTSFMVYASENDLAGIERELWHALFYFANLKAIGNVFPEGFLLISNKRMLSMLSYGDDTLIKARDMLGRAA
ncbi:hypothetical protein FACS1894184_04730 [Clostridia bacterium]|nr:hypothetical protein FACS1894184_04730 [Clostridia bacterium]